MKPLTWHLGASGGPRRSVPSAGKPAPRSLPHHAAAARAMHAPDIPILGAPGRAGIARMDLRSAGLGVLVLLLIAALAPAPLGHNVRSASPSACVAATTLAAVAAPPCARRGA